MSNNHNAISQAHANYLLVAKAIKYLINQQCEQPSLAETASEIGVSEYHFQRIFSEWAGVSPKQFLSYLTKENAKTILRHNSVLNSAIDLGLSGPSRLHDLFITYESVTPGKYKTWGKGLTIHFGVHSCLLGYCFIAVTKRGLCKLAFFDNEIELNCLMDELYRNWENATIKLDKQETQAYFQAVFLNNNTHKPIHLLLKGTPFRTQVWQALLAVPSGHLSTYGQIAKSIQRPQATRAVASAIANNPIAFLIPCHRVIKNTGVLNQYRWGAERKAALIGLEQSRLMQMD